MLASAHLPFTQTGATAVFSKQAGMLAGLVAESGGMIAGVTAVESSDVPSGLLMTLVQKQMSGFVVTSCGLLNSAP